MNLYNKTSIDIIIGFSIILVYYIPYFIYGENTFINYHDFLDSNHVYLKLLKEQGNLFNTDGILNTLDGIVISTIDSLYPIRLILYYIFNPFKAFLINDIIVKLIAFLGMYLLLSNLGKNNQGKFQRLITFSCSLLFSLIFFHDGYYGISSAGIPLIIYAFISLMEKRHLIVNYIIIIFYVSYSSLFLSGLFIGIFLFGYYLYVISSSKTKYPHYFYGLIIYGIACIIFNYQMFISFFIPDEEMYISHRTQFLSTSNIKEIVLGIKSLMLCTQYHSGVLPTRYIILSVLILYIMNRKLPYTIKKISLIIIGIILFWGVYQSLKILFPHIQFIQMFQADRFYFMLPTIWIILLFFSFVNLQSQKTGIFIITICSIGVFSDIIRSNNEYIFIIKKTIKRSNTEPSYKQFYDTALFCKIKEDILSKDEKVCAIGMYPSILQYNNIKTIDSYHVSYNINYKNQFRKIIAKELDKSQQLKNYFDNWGSRCYIFSSELGLNFMWGKEAKGKVSNLEINTEALKEMDCSYIFSAVEIENYKQLNIKPVGEYTTPTSYWKIYVYKV